MSVNVIELTRTHATDRLEALNGEIADAVAELAQRYMERAVIQCQLDVMEAMRVAPSVIPRAIGLLHKDEAPPGSLPMMARVGG